MAKRFTDSNRWKKQAWLKQLTPHQKLAWVYISDECDHAGLWKIDVVDLKEYTGLTEFNLKEFVHACNQDYDKLTGERIIRERVKVINNEYLWITGFIDFQYSGKNKELPKNNIVLSAIEILKSLSLFNEAISKGFVNPSASLLEVLQKGNERVKDKDRDKGKGLIEKEGGVEEEKTFYPAHQEQSTIHTCLANVQVPDQLDDPDFRKAYLDYWVYVKGKFSNWPQPVQVQNQYQELIELQRDGNDPEKVIRQTINAGNKSFYKLKSFDKQSNGTRHDKSANNLRELGNDPL